MEDSQSRISFRNELIRKAIHLSSAVIPLSYYFIERETEIIILLILSFILILSDLFRIKSEKFQNFFLKVLKPVLRGHEIRNEKSLFNGGTYLIIGFLLCVIIFPKPVAIASMLIVIFCDSFAAIAGKNYGKHFVGNKSLEGSLAFFLSGSIIVLLTPKVSGSVLEYVTGIAAVLLTAIFELIPLKIDDNISIPVFFGLVYLILFKIIL